MSIFTPCRIFQSSPIFDNILFQYKEEADRQEIPLLERATNICNLMDNQTLRKKTALVEVLKEHPVRKLFQAAERCLDMECELELESCDAEEVMEQGEISKVVDEKNPLH